MAEDIKNVNVEEEEEDIITLEFDDDTAVDCYVLGTFELNDKEYIALEPEDGTDDVYIYGYKQISDDEFEIIEIESEEEFDAAAAEFDAIMAEEYAEGMAKYYESAHDFIPSQFEKYLRKVNPRALPLHI